MATLTPYLFFDGKCKDAMNFYRDCFGGDLFIQTYKDVQGSKVSSEDQNKICHARLSKDHFQLMASDSCQSSLDKNPTSIPSSPHIAIKCSTKDEMNQLFNSLGKKGKVIEPIHDAFWGAYFGMLVDQFGIHWMLDCEKNK